METAAEDRYLSAVVQIANRRDRSDTKTRGTDGHVVTRRPRDQRKRPLTGLAFMLVHAIAAALKGWAGRERDHRELRDLSDRDLRDLGLTRADILRESRKVFW